MADKKISALPASTTPLAGTEVLPIVQGGTTKQVSVDNLTSGKTVGAATFRSADGTQSAPAYSFASSTDSGLFYGSSYVQLSAHNVNYILAGSSVIYLNFATVVTGNLTASTGNLVIGTAGKGIDFSANTHAAGMTSELLNDYEEGTFTPTISSTIGSITAYTINSARYTKIGRAVHIVVQFFVSDNGTGAGQIYLQGLPFTNAVATCGMTYNQSTGAVGAISVSTSATDGYINQYNGLYPVVSGQTLQLNLTYIV